MSSLKKAQKLGHSIIVDMDKMENHLSRIAGIPWEVGRELENAREFMRRMMHDLVSLTSTEKREVPENERAYRVDDWPHAQQRAT